MQQTSFVRFLHWSDHKSQGIYPAAQAFVFLHLDAAHVPADGAVGGIQMEDTLCVVVQRVVMRRSPELPDGLVAQIKVDGLFRQNFKAAACCIRQAQILQLLPAAASGEGNKQNFQLPSRDSTF